MVRHLKLTCWNSCSILTSLTAGLNLAEYIDDAMKIVEAGAIFDDERPSLIWGNATCPLQPYPRTLTQIATSFYLSGWCHVMKAFMAYLKHATTFTYTLI
jgi:hypothetical protein